VWCRKGGDVLLESRMHVEEEMEYPIAKIQVSEFNGGPNQDALRIP